jgi:hypothetical protein
VNSKGISANARKYLERIKSMPCGVCDAPAPSEAHHIKQGLHFVCIPVCASCHRDGFNGWHGQRRMWKVMKKDELIVLSETIEKLARGG